jgi:cation:H+ antiporter
MIYIQILGGLAFLYLGGEAIIRGSVAAAGRLGVSAFMIGATLVGFGTSTPELVTSVEAALLGSPGIAIGNVVGSNIANVLLVLGLTAACVPIVVRSRTLWRDLGVLAAATVLCGLVLMSGSITRVLGALLALALVAYTLALVWAEPRVPRGPGVGTTKAPSLSGSVLLAVCGIGSTIAGAYFLVDGSIGLARSLGVSETVIGLTVVAVGTALPELAAGLVAVLRRQPDVALGNIVGSCVYNLLGVLGLTALVQPLEVPPEILGFDLWVLAGSVVLLILVGLSGHRIRRIEGVVLLLAYVGYILGLVTGA